MKRPDKLQKRLQAARERLAALPPGPKAKAAQQAEQERILRRVLEIHDAGEEAGPDEEQTVVETFHQMSGVIEVFDQMAADGVFDYHAIQAGQRPPSEFYQNGP